MSSDISSDGFSRDVIRVRSLLFAPASDDRKLSRALASDADLVVADLEDAVAPNEKKRGRELIGHLFSGLPSRPYRTVRINEMDSEHVDDDLGLVADLDVDAVIVPKATPEGIATIPLAIPIIANVETPYGVQMAREIAAAPGVIALLFGGIDLSACLGLEARSDGQELLFARSKLVLDSASAGIRGPFDVAYLSVADGVGLEEQARLARSLGFSGKACIHPTQVPIVNRVFTPSPERIRWARGVVDGYQQGVAAGKGAVVVDGRMVDIAVVRWAERILAQVWDPQAADSVPRPGD